MSIVAEDADLQMQWTRWVNRRNAAARDHLIVCYSPLVKFVAGRVGAGLPSNVDSGDLISSGMFGLIDAIERFDTNFGVKFETFAVPRIRGSIYDGLRQLDWVPRLVRSRARFIEQAISELEHKLGRGPTDDELSEHLGITPQDLAKWLWPLLGRRWVHLTERLREAPNRRLLTTLCRAHHLQWSKNVS